MTDRTIRVVIRGRVQGVGFRAWTQVQAETHGLRGWVRNRRDGAVEAVFAGSEEAVAAMLTACERGPRWAKVTGVEAVEDDRAEPGSGFAVRPTV